MSTKRAPAVVNIIMNTRNAAADMTMSIIMCTRHAAADMTMSIIMRMRRVLADMSIITMAMAATADMITAICRPMSADR